MAAWIKTDTGWVRKGAVLAPIADAAGYGKTPYGKKYGK